MLSLISSLGGLLLSGLPNLLAFFQDRADKDQERALAKMQMERELALAARGFAAQERIEEIRVEQIATQSQAQMQNAALDHDKKLMERASPWVVNINAMVRPAVTFIFVFELVAINASLAWYAYTHTGTITNLQELIAFSDALFTDGEEAMLAGIVSFWFGSRSWGKK